MRYINTEEFLKLTDEELGRILYAQNDGQGDTSLETLIEFRKTFEKDGASLTNKELLDIMWEVHPVGNLVAYKMIHIVDGKIETEEIWITE
jgi:hypothetical protein